MRQSTCEHCNKTLPMNETFAVFGKLLCSGCAEQEVGRYEGKLEPGDIIRQADPTICVNCQTDNGNEAYPLLAGAPVCESCVYFFRHRPYPNWLKAAAIALLFLAAFAFLHNFRFIQGYLEQSRAVRFLQKGDFDKAVPLFVAAADHVPESEELAATATMFQAITLLKDDKSREALALLQQSKRRWPANPILDYFILQAELGAAFDDKDYDQFLAKALALLQAKPNEAEALGAVASAYACKYAVTGQEKFKIESLHYLDLATEKAKPGDPQFRDYAERIRHRLQTREIITRQEYQRRFPQGRKAAKP